MVLGVICTFYIKTMAVNKEAYIRLRDELNAKGVTLVAVSKTKPAEEIAALYELGQRDFGENYVLELVAKAAVLPSDIHWHFIGHLQTNKVKLIVPFVQLIQGVDSLKLLKEINKQAANTGRVIDCLLQVHIAMEETKFGLSGEELDGLLKELDQSPLANIRVRGLMGMASFTDNMDTVRNEFRKLKYHFGRSRFKGQPLEILSMGMSSDYRVALEEGSNLVRIGSLLFGERENIGKTRP